MDAGLSLLGTPREWARDLTAATVIGAFLGVIGPFGSFYGGPLAARVPYWIANLWIGFIFLSMIIRISLYGAQRLDLPTWFTLAVGVAAGAAPLGYFLAVFSSLVWPGSHGHIRPLADWYTQTLVIAEPCAFGYFYLDARWWRFRALGAPPAPQEGSAERSASDAGTPPPDVIVGSRFLQRLPVRLGREILCLQMEDHYVRAHTALGSDLILTPLKQAMAEIEDEGGIQVHRSWWVHRRAVDEALIDGRRVVLRLVNGLEVPVSRAAVARVRAAGWLDGRDQPGAPRMRKIDAPA